MSRLKVAAQLIQDDEYKLALDMLKRDESSIESFRWRSLICRLLDLYDDEKKIIDTGLKQHGTDTYLRERAAWHKLPVFERMVPRQPLRMPRDGLNIPPQSAIEQLCFVTGADSNYFELLVECIESIRSTPTYKDCAVAVFDCGLKDHQKEYLIAQLHVVSIKDPGWSVNCDTFHRYSPSRDQSFTSPLKQNPGNKCIAARAAMNQHFPGYRYYMWIDADAWIQDERAVDVMLSTCLTQYCAGAQHCSWSIGNTGFLKSNLFDEDKKALIATRPTIAGGVCCFDANSGFMEQWAKLMQDSIDKYGYWYTQDECALNYLFYKYNFSKILPYECNYRFSPGIPVMQVQDPTLRNPANNKIIGIVHLPSIQKEKYYFNTHILNGPMNDNNLQQHAHQTSLIMRDPNYQVDMTRPALSLRYRVYPWQDKVQIKKVLNQEVTNV